ncbi:RimK/LysX family protein [Hyphococcus flavus]|uniref:RimK/LysX family protein n=1 Tax=Hyphococcus flavus TaxID=1866326 RepID=A0AAE9ZAA8_9PROT|nr:RimK/LysX family protein [Hyphococcus flavus]WDI30454.1 RimK/LysX family protein [Hyphococcus flavus]
MTRFDIPTPNKLLANAGTEMISMPFRFALVFSFMLATAAAAADEDVRGEPVTLGFIENVAVGNLNLEMKGKLDTGADTTSVHAFNVEVYKRGKRDNWVKFRLVGKDGRSIRYDQNVIRFANIKTKTGGTIRRPVIHLPICINGRRGRAEVNLADRGDFEYDILIGREFLANRILVDSSRTFMAEEECGPVDED